MTTLSVVRELQLAHTMLLDHHRHHRFEHQKIYSFIIFHETNTQKKEIKRREKKK